MQRNIILLFVYFIVCPISYGMANTLSADTSYTMIATYYADMFVGRKTSSGEVFTHDKYTCAHNNIPLGTYVEVTNPKNNQQVVLKVNDRCPRNGVVDMTRTALQALGIKGRGTVQVRILGDVVLTESPTPNSLDETPKKTGRRKKQKTSSPDTKKASENTSNDTKQEIDTEKTPRQEKKHSSAAPAQRPTPPPQPTYYDILLCTEKTRHQAELHVSLLSPEYQSKTIYRTTENGRTQAIIQLAMTERNITPIVEEIRISHPRITIIPTSKKKKK